MTKWLRFVGYSAIVVMPVGAFAQAGDANVEIAAAAVRAVRAEFPGRRLVVNVARDTTLAKQLALNLGARVGELASVRVCPGNPSSCALVGADLMVVVTTIRTSAGTSTVSLETYFPSGHRFQPVAFVSHEVRLVRQANGCWEVTSKSVTERS